MSWTTPRTWSPGETETAAIFNAHLRDNANFIKTSRRDAGQPIRALRTVAWTGTASAGVNSNNAGGADTVLSGYTWTMPANTWYTYGDALIIDGIAVVLTNNANTKTLKVKLGSATAVTIATGAFTQFTNLPFRYILSFDSATSIGIWGITHYGASGAVSSQLLYVGSFSVSSVLTNALDLSLVAAGNTAQDMVMMDCWLYTSYGITGALV